MYNLILTCIEIKLETSVSYYLQKLDIYDLPTTFNLMTSLLS